MHRVTSLLFFFQFINYIEALNYLQLSPTFRADFLVAEETFRHQVVHDVRTERNVHLTPLPEGTSSTDVPFAGSLITAEKASHTFY